MCRLVVVAVVAAAEQPSVGNGCNPVDTVILMTTMYPT